LQEPAIDIGDAIAILPPLILDEELELTEPSLLGELRSAHEHVGAHAEQARGAGTPFRPGGLGLREWLQPKLVIRCFCIP
jgi:hypothetical protein